MGKRYKYSSDLMKDAFERCFFNTEIVEDPKNKDSLKFKRRTKCRLYFDYKGEEFVLDIKEDYGERPFVVKIGDKNYIKLCKAKLYGGTSSASHRQIQSELKYSLHYNVFELLAETDLESNVTRFGNKDLIIEEVNGVKIIDGKVNCLQNDNLVIENKNVSGFKFKNISRVNLRKCYLNNDNYVLNKNNNKCTFEECDRVVIDSCFMLNGLVCANKCNTFNCSNSILDNVRFSNVDNANMLVSIANLVFLEKSDLTLISSNVDITKSLDKESNLSLIDNSRTTLNCDLKSLSSNSSSVRLLRNSSIKEKHIVGSHVRPHNDLSAPRIDFDQCGDGIECIGWKSVKAINKETGGSRCVILQLKIDKDTPRVDPKNEEQYKQKRRAERVFVMAAFEKDGTKISDKELEKLTLVPHYRNYDNDFVYKVGEEAVARGFCDDPKKECCGGIHFFDNFGRAMDYA